MDEANVHFLDQKFQPPTSHGNPSNTLIPLDQLCVAAAIFTVIVFILFVLAQFTIESCK